MNRIKDYGSFAVWFLGLSYMAMWPLSMPELGLLAGVGACDQSLTPRVLCDLAHPVSLPLALHVVGLLAAVFVVVRLLLIALRSSRHTPAGAADQSAASPPRSFLRLRRPPPTVQRIKGRDHFGLRGMSD
jgi:hypothetical protein